MRKLVVLMIILMLCVAMLAGCSAKGTGDGAAPDAAFSLVIDIATLSGDVSFFDYNAGGTAMQLIARVDDSGAPKLSYNTCQSCQGSPFAYFEVVDGLLVCRNCGNLFTFDSIGQKQAYGCLPIAVDDYTVEDGRVIVSAETLDGMKSAFVNWKKGL